MLNWVIIALMLAMAALYTPAKPELDSLIASNEQVGLAEDMDVYRKAVISYFSKYPGTIGAADPIEVKGFLPSWSTMKEPVTGVVVWNNFRASNGTIFIYSNLPQEKAWPVLADLYEISKHSALVGYNDNGFFKPFNNSVAVNVAMPSGVAMPDKSVIWLANIN